MVTTYLIGISQTAHTRHNSQHVVVGSIDTHLGSLGTFNSGVGKNELKSSVINSGEVARARGLMLLRAEGE